MPTDALLSDRLRVRETIERYFSSVDAKDREGLISCFAEEAEAEHQLGTPEHNRVTGGRAVAESVYAICSGFTASNHSVSNFVVEISGDKAEANTFAIAVVIKGSQALVRGLRYQDSLRRTAQGWRISRRMQTPLWQTESAALPPKLG